MDNKKLEEILKPGTLFLDKRFKIIKFIAAGGTGLVFLAEDLKLNNQKRAIKFTDYKTSKDKFGAELQTSLKLVNAVGLPTVQHYDKVKIGDKIYLYMITEYFEKGQLDKYFTEDKFLILTKEELKYYFPKILTGASALHKQNFLHKDIKPANILINENNVPIITDFDIAWKVKSFDQKIPKGGTAIFTAPESVLIEQTSSSDKPVFTSDIYSLGVTLYYLSTGIMPYDNEPIKNIVKKGSNYKALRYMAQAEQSAWTEYINPSFYNHNIDNDLEYIINKMMAKEHTYRYQSVQEVIDDFEKWSEGKEIKKTSFNTNEFKSKNSIKTLIAKEYVTVLLKLKKTFDKKFFAIIFVLLAACILAFILVGVLT